MMTTNHETHICLHLYPCLYLGLNQTVTYYAQINAHVETSHNKSP